MKKLYILYSDFFTLLKWYVKNRILTLPYLAYARYGKCRSFMDTTFDNCQVFCHVLMMLKNGLSFAYM